jgi:DNA polymerase II small subunit
MATIADAARAFITRGRIVADEDAHAIRDLSTNQLEELCAVLEELPASDFERITSIERFVRLFKTLDRNSFFERKRALIQASGKGFFEDMLTHYERSIDTRSDWEIVFSYEEFVKKRVYADFVQFFRNRHKQIGEILKGRYELRDALPARRITTKNDRESVAFIGLITETNETKNGNIIIQAEDPTGTLTLIAHKSKPDIITACKDLVPDEVVGFRGTRSSDAVFIDDVIWPDVPIDSPLHTVDEDIGAVFISDVQYGQQFLHQEFNAFCTWLAQESEDNRDLARNTKYLFIVGDLVDGVGVVPNQQERLDVKDIYAQFEHVTAYLKLIPKHITIFICPGNHDPTRLAEPQPPLPEEYARALYEMPNVVLLSNPSSVRIGVSPKSSGIEVLLYHGFSFDYYAQNVDSIRESGGYEAPLELMKFLLKRRHLAPTYASTQLIPETRKDYHVIERVPDIFASGHLHRMQAGTYRSTTLLQCGAWMGKTAFEEKMGHNPVPGKAFHVNLKTRKVSQIDFVTPERERILNERGWL